MIARRMISQLLSFGSITMVNAANAIGRKQRISNTIRLSFVSSTLENLDKEIKNAAQLKIVIAGTKKRPYVLSSGIVSLTWSDTSKSSDKP
ncbi:MAG TPA: hypothetical protein HPP66_04305 [Planctomycetes bacterium]|nr:hypothetical protein [Planctomycetota bacterium]